jgi:hypothetical protein
VNCAKEERKSHDQEHPEVAKRLRLHDCALLAV